ncbi:Z1 domain-containing protein [Microbacterium sp. NPDC019599]|uniref:Z1 domain-containing protein n=1 Tax=Microbacterium sp. NPDC019599 TaxID=3154690 RepID=UPI0033FF07D4
MTEVRVVPVDTVSPPMHWVAKSGDRVSASIAKMRTRIGDAEALRVAGDSLDILGHCVDPIAPSTQSAVLVVGQVQSGKTMSFTTLIAAARDNGFGLVILLAGTKNNLRSQSEDRLTRDLDMGKLETRDAWRHYSNPGPLRRDDVAQTLRNWKRFTIEGGRSRPTVVITALKQTTRIESLTTLLRSLELADVPALIVDDEADQASLNTRARFNLLNDANERSRTYSTIDALRSAVPHHTFVQYTATPQANLLLGISDALNPEYVRVIDSGSSYTGGDYFFVKRRSELVKRLPETDLVDDYSDPPEIAPASLQEALRVFLLGCAVVDLHGLAENRSMMLQVAQATEPHQLYKNWVTRLVATWPNLVERSEGAEELLLGWQAAYDELARTVGELPPLRELIGAIPEVCAELQVVEVNSTPTGEEVDWERDRFWILIGGLKLDRGYTVEGLTVTYIPRPAPGSTDVLQQRARFFGYRAPFGDFCRIYLPKTLEDEFVAYVKDEKALRDTLAAWHGRPLREWKRQFFISQGIRHFARTSVIGRRTSRLKLEGGWVWPRQMDSGAEAIANNLGLLRAYREYLISMDTPQGVESIPGVVDKRRGVVPHEYFPNVGPTELLNVLLTLELIDQGDRVLMTALTRYVAYFQPDVDLVILSGLTTDGQRGRDPKSFRQNPFVGRNPQTVSEASPLLYSGERELRHADRFTVQFRQVTFTGGETPVPWAHFFVPKVAEKDVVVEVF